jgi:hypothetical protein
MAGDWIKFETTTLDKPEVFEMAAELAIDPDAVVGKCLRVWSWFDSHSRDGNAPVTVLALLNRITGVANFTDAMEKVGWLVIDGATVSLPKFDRHNGKTAKERALGKNRTKKSRNGNAECNADTVTTPSQKALPEKRREEKNSTHSLSPARGGDDGDGEAMAGDLADPSDETTIEQSADPAMRPGFPEKQAVLDYCVAQGWPVTSGSLFWLHYDQARSNGEPIGRNWHWWSKLEAWVMRDTALGGGLNRSASRPGPAAKTTIANYDKPEDWTDDQMSLLPVSKS